MVLWFVTWLAVTCAITGPGDPGGGPVYFDLVFSNEDARLYENAMSGRLAINNMEGFKDNVFKSVLNIAMDTRGGQDEVRRYFSTREALHIQEIARHVRNSWVFIKSLSPESLVKYYSSLHMVISRRRVLSDQYIDITTAKGSYTDNICSEHLCPYGKVTIESMERYGRMTVQLYWVTNRRPLNITLDKVSTYYSGPKCLDGGIKLIARLVSPRPILDACGQVQAQSFLVEDAEDAKFLADLHTSDQKQVIKLSYHVISRDELSRLRNNPARTTYERIPLGQTRGVYAMDWPHTSTAERGRFSMWIFHIIANPELKITVDTVIFMTSEQPVYVFDGPGPMSSRLAANRNRFYNALVQQEGDGWRYEGTTYHTTVYLTSASRTTSLRSMIQLLRFHYNHSVSNTQPATCGGDLSSHHLVSPGAEVSFHMSSSLSQPNTWCRYLVTTTFPSLVVTVNSFSYQGSSSGYCETGGLFVTGRDQSEGWQGDLALPDYYYRSTYVNCIGTDSPVTLYTLDNLAVINVFHLHRYTAITMGVTVAPSGCHTLAVNPCDFNAAYTDADPYLGESIEDLPDHFSPPITHRQIESDFYTDLLYRSPDDTGEDKLVYTNSPPLDRGLYLSDTKQALMYYMNGPSVVSLKSQCFRIQQLSQYNIIQKYSSIEDLKQPYLKCNIIIHTPVVGSFDLRMNTYKSSTPGPRLYGSIPCTSQAKHCPEFAAVVTSMTSSNYGLHRSKTVFYPSIPDHIEGINLQMMRITMFIGIHSNNVFDIKITKNGSDDTVLGPPSENYFSDGFLSSGTWFSPVLAGHNEVTSQWWLDLTPILLQLVRKSYPNIVNMIQDIHQHVTIADVITLLGDCDGRYYSSRVLTITVRTKPNPCSAHCSAHLVTITDKHNTWVFQGNKTHTLTIPFVYFDDIIQDGIHLLPINVILTDVPRCMDPCTPQVLYEQGCLPSQNTNHPKAQIKLLTTHNKISWLDAQEKCHAITMELVVTKSKVELDNLKIMEGELLLKAHIGQYIPIGLLFKVTK